VSHDEAGKIEPIPILREHLVFDKALGHTVRVERQTSETDALFFEEGSFKIITSNGELFCRGPVWILWDTSGYPYPITPDEFNKLYVKVDEK